MRKLRIWEENQWSNPVENDPTVGIMIDILGVAALLLALMVSVMIVKAHHRKMKKAEVAESYNEDVGPAIIDTMELADFPAKPPVSEENDPYKVYAVDKNWIMAQPENDDRYWVERDGRCYLLGWKMPGNIVKKYNVGWQEGAFSPKKPAYLWLYDEDVWDVPTNADSGALISCGRFPTFKIYKGEKIKLYGYGFDTVVLSKCNEYGSTIRAFEYGGYYHPVRNDIFDYSKDGHEAYVYGQNGGVNDVRNLEFLADYTYSWYDGDREFKQVEMVADCKCYTISDNPEIINVSVDKDGTKYIETASFEDGTYTIGRRVVFEIVG